MKGKEKKKMEKQRQRTQDAIELLEEMISRMRLLETAGLKQENIEALEITIKLLKNGLPLLSFICEIQEHLRGGIKNKEDIKEELKDSMYAKDDGYFEECYKIAINRV